MDGAASNSSPSVYLLSPPVLITIFYTTRFASWAAFAFHSDTYGSSAAMLMVRTNEPIVCFLHHTKGALSPDLIFYPYPIFLSPALSGVRMTGSGRDEAGVAVMLLHTDRKLRRAYKLRSRCPGGRAGSTGYGVRGEEQRRTRAHRIRSARHEGRSVEPRPAGCSTVRTGTAQARAELHWG